MTHEVASAYRFGACTLVVASRELRRDDGSVVALAPKLFDALAWLIRHRDRAVGRDELIAAVWGDAGTPDNLLAQVIARLRRLVDGDAPAADSAIRTVPRFGYRWVAEVVELDDAVVSPVPAAAAGEGDRPSWPAVVAARDRRGLAAWVAGLAMLALLVAAGSAWWRDGEAPRAGTDARPLAVLLPVELAVGDDEAWMRLGLMGVIGDRLQAAGQRLVPDEASLALVRATQSRLEAPPDVARVLALSPAVFAIRAQARRVDGRWQVSLATQGDVDDTRSIGEADDAIDAARLAADRFAAKRGLEVAPGGGTAAGTGPGELLVRVEAAALAADGARVRRLVEGAGEAERNAPELRYLLGWAAFEGGDLAGAEARYAALLKDDVLVDQPLLRARVLNGLANVRYARGDLEGTRRASDEALAVLGTQDAGVERARALVGRAAATSRATPDAARDDLALARMQFEAAGDRLGLARAESAAGVLEMAAGRLHEALPLFERAVDRFAAFGDLHDELVTRTHVVHVHLLLLEPGAALAGEARLADLVAQVPPSRARALARLTRAEVLAANGRLGLARRVLAEACTASPEAACPEWPLQHAWLGHVLGVVREDALDAVLAGPAGSEPGRDVGRARVARVRARLAQGDVGAARDVAGGAQAWASRVGTADSRTYADLAEALVRVAEGDEAGASAAFAGASRRATAGRVPFDVLRVAEAEADWHLAREDLDAAMLAAARVADAARVDFDAALLQLRVRHAVGQVDPWSAALVRARSLAGEREVPAGLAAAPEASAVASGEAESPAATPRSRR
ncbi:winged helix-turn-helix domain-containing protein [Dokdonella sp. MW10]|uniref:winged helix-turn-helix domain-containing protein n=1 Tax=Dokdonella sp. MW10 TaxID=2992926 RepID=UPI003F7D8763